MPWQESRPVDQRLWLVADHQRALYDMTTLCARDGVSRKTQAPDPCTSRA